MPTVIHSVPGGPLHKSVGFVADGLCAGMHGSMYGLCLHKIGGQFTELVSRPWGDGDFPGLMCISFSCFRSVY